MIIFSILLCKEMIYLFDFFCLLGILFILYTIVKYKEDNKKFLICFLTVTFLLRIGVVFILKTPLQSDFLILYEAASNFVEGNNLMNTSSYFQSWSYQTGIVLFYSLFLSIWNNVIILKIVNCILSTLLCYLVYLISRCFSSEISSRFVAVLYSIFIFPLLYNTILSNQIPAAVCFYFGIYFLLKQNELSLKVILISSICFVLGNILRPEGIIFVCSLIGYLILTISKLNARKNAVYICILSLSYMLFFYSASFFVMKTNINNKGLSNNNPYWKFLIGMNIESNGHYNEYDASIPINEQKDLLISRIEKMKFSEFVGLVGNKLSVSFSEGTNWWSIFHLDLSEKFLGINLNFIIEKLNSINYLTYLFVFMLFLFGIVFKFENKGLLLFNILAINLVAYIFIEVQARYAYLLQISIFCLASLGLDGIKEFIKYKLKCIMDLRKDSNQKIS